MKDPHAVLREAVGGNRVLGIVMIGLGLAACAPAALDYRRPIMQMNILAVSASLFLLGPGILYQIAAGALKHREERAGRMSMCIGIAQAGFSIVALGLMLLGLVRSPAMAPLLANLFFVPAALAQAWKLSRAIRAIRLLPSTSHGFEAIARPTLPVLPVQSMESDPIDRDLEK